MKPTARLGMFALAMWFVCIGLTGCQNQLAELMVSSPNRLNPWADNPSRLPPIESMAGVDQHFYVPVGPPEATLSVSVIEPRDGMPAPRGTILVLHGIYTRSLSMIPRAMKLADAGYRTVLVDLRGHGGSTGDYISFGVREARDLSQVIDALHERKLVAGRLGVYGVSFGAATSIQLAGCDPRIEAVVAVAPFSAMRDEVPHFGRTMVPGVGWAVTDRGYQGAIDEAGRVAQFDPNEASAVEAIRRTKAQVLIIHGTNDWVVPHWHGERLHKAAPDHSELVSIPLQGHTTIWMDPTGKVARHSKAWFDRWL